MHSPVLLTYFRNPSSSYSLTVTGPLYFLITQCSNELLLEVALKLSFSMNTSTFLKSFHVNQHIQDLVSLEASPLLIYQPSTMQCSILTAERLMVVLRHV